MTEVDLCKSRQDQIKTVLEKLDCCLRLDVIVYDTFDNLATDLKKRDWAIIFDVLFVVFFQNRCNVSFFPVTWKHFTFQAIPEYFEERFYYSVARHFEHANTDHIITMSFIRIEFSDDTFYIILREFNVCQLLIGNGNS